LVWKLLAFESYDPVFSYYLNQFVTTSHLLLLHKIKHHNI